MSNYILEKIEEAKRKEKLAKERLRDYYNNNFITEQLYLNNTMVHIRI